jgi:hypothetical protein
MKIITAFAVGLTLAVALPAVSAQAQNARSFVSAHGSDSAACTLAAPCRTLQHAHDQTNAGGEIDVLDPAGYGSLTINKAISIVNDGVGTAGVIVPSGDTGILINAAASEAVSLRGLSIEGNGVGTTGIQFNSGKFLTVEYCTIRHVAGNAITFEPNVPSSLSVSNSLVADNSTVGIAIQPSGSGAVTAVFDRVQANNNTYGIYVSGTFSTGTINVSVSESVASGNSNSDFQAITNAGKAPTTLMLFHSVAANAGTGLIANGVGATLRLANSAVTGNGAGWNVSSGGVIASYGDDYIDGNGPNTGSLTPIVRQ